MRYTCTACDINTCSVRRVQCVQSLLSQSLHSVRACERACVRARRGLHRPDAVSAASREMQRERVGSTRGSVAAIRVQRRTRPYSVNETAALLHNTQRSLLPYAARLIHATHSLPRLAATVDTQRSPLPHAAARTPLTHCKDTARTTPMPIPIQAPALRCESVSVAVHVSTIS